MKVFINPGHAPNGNPDPGACNDGMGLRECDVAASVGRMLEGYLVAAGVEVVGNLQSDYLDEVSGEANASGADLFISLHCNACNSCAQGTEVLICSAGGKSAELAQYIQNQIVNSLGTLDRGLKERPGLHVLRCTDMPAVLVEMAFIDNGEDAELLRDRQDDFARAIARGVTDYICGGTAPAPTVPAPASGGRATYFSADEMMCHGAELGQCNCGIETAEKVSSRLLELLDKLRENIGGPLEVSCMYRCPAHNAAIGGAPKSQHMLGTAADIQTPNYPYCHTPEQLLWYCKQLPFDGFGLYEWGVHVDVRDGGVGSGIEW